MNIIKKTSEPYIDSRSENKKVHLINKYFRDNENVDSEFWEYIGYKEIINSLINFDKNDLKDLVKDFDYWNSEDLRILGEMFAFIEEYDVQEKLIEIDRTELYCEVFLKTNELDSDDLLINLKYVLDKNQNQGKDLLNQLESKIISLKNSNNRIQPNDLYNETLKFIRTIKNYR